MSTSTAQPEAPVSGPAPEQPRKEHEWLRQLVGEWTATCGMPDESGQTVETTWTESVRAIGDLWILAESAGEMPGCGPMTTLMTLGFDPRKGRYVGTWVGSPMSHLWVYEGTLDEDTRVLTLDTEGPSMTKEGELGSYRDVTEIRSADHRVLTSQMLGEDGTWQQFMEVHYHRTA